MYKSDVAHQDIHEDGNGGMPLACGSSYAIPLSWRIPAATHLLTQKSKVNSLHPMVRIVDLYPHRTHIVAWQLYFLTRKCPCGQQPKLMCRAQLLQSSHEVHEFARCT